VSKDGGGLREPIAIEIVAASASANGEPQTGHRSPIGSPSLLYRRVWHVRHLRCGTGTSCQSRVRVMYTQRGSFRPNGSAAVRVAGAGRVLRHRWASVADKTRRRARSRANSPRLKATHFRSVSLMVSTRVPVSLLGARARKRARNPGAFNQIGTEPPGRSDNALTALQPAR
jgi:hypothetical protein